jgi:hypothetical protein
MDSVDHHPMTHQQRLAEKYASPSADGKNRRPIHHSPLFWGGVILFVLAISVYVFTDSLAWMPLRSG